MSRTCSLTMSSAPCLALSTASPLAQPRPPVTPYPPPPAPFQLFPVSPQAPQMALEAPRQNTINMASPCCPSLAPCPSRSGEDRPALRHPAWHFDALAGDSWAMPQSPRPFGLSQRFKIVLCVSPWPDGDNCTIILDAVYRLVE